MQGSLTLLPHARVPDPLDPQVAGAVRAAAVVSCLAGLGRLVRCGALASYRAPSWALEAAARDRCAALLV